MLNAFATIPLIDIQPLLRGDREARAHTAAELGAAARDVGFLYVTGHGVAPSLFDDLLAEAKAFFAQPLAEKMRVYIGLSSNHRG